MMIQKRSHRAGFTVATAAAILALVCGSGGATAAQEAPALGDGSSGDRGVVQARGDYSIVGTWAVEGGLVEVKQDSSDSNFSWVGRIVQPLTSTCPFTVGEGVWFIRQGSPSTSQPLSSGFAYYADPSSSGCYPQGDPVEFRWVNANTLNVVREVSGYAGLEYVPLYAATRVGGSPDDDGDDDAVATDTSPPVIEAIGSSTPAPLGSKPSLQYRVTDDSGTARVRVALYSDGVVAFAGVTGGFRKATGQLQQATLKKDPTSTGYFGPFYFCVWAEDKAGNRSAGWPESSCAWRPIEVDMKALVKANKVNRCGPNNGYASTIAWNLLLNVRTVGGIPVGFFPACNAHDAGYWGYAFRNPVTREVVDTRTWSRNEVDNRFRADLETLCARRLSDHPDLLAECQTSDTFGATAYFIAVDYGGRGGFDADATRPGTQHELPASTNPVGGGRDPGDPR